MTRIKTLCHQGKRHIPLPTGPHTIGCMDVMTSYSKFGVFARIYYPSKEHNVLERHLQWPLWVPHEQYINGYALRAGAIPSLFQMLFKFYVGKLYIPAIWQAPIEQSGEKYPVIIFSHGLSGWRTTYSALCLELASYGFVVAAVEHRDYSASASFYKKQSRMSRSGESPGSSLCTYDELLSSPASFEIEENIGPISHVTEWILYQTPTKENEFSLRQRQVHQRAKECAAALSLMEDLNIGRDVQNVLDSNFNAAMFENRLDMKNAIFMGHSFGGATGMICLATEPRFKAGVFLDPWMFPFFKNEEHLSAIKKPFLCLLVESFQCKQSLQILKRLQDSQKHGQFLIMKDADHRDLSDTIFLPRWSCPLSSPFSHRIDKFSALDISADTILHFLETILGKHLCPVNQKIENLKKVYLRTGEYIAEIA